LGRLQEMLRVNIRQNLQLAVQIATKNSDIVEPIKLVELFRSFNGFEGLFYHLGCIVSLPNTLVESAKSSVSAV